MLFVLSDSPKTATEVKPESFAGLKPSERLDLQEWVISAPSLLGDDLLVITSEFDQFDRTSERLEVSAKARRSPRRDYAPRPISMWDPRRRTSGSLTPCGASWMPLRESSGAR